MYVNHTDLHVHVSVFFNLNKTRKVQATQTGDIDCISKKCGAWALVQHSTTKRAESTCTFIYMYGHTENYIIHVVSAVSTHEGEYGMT